MMPTKTYRNGVGPSENEIQAAFFDWLAVHEKKYPDLSLMFAIPNGSHKSPAARGLFKRTGLKPGVPDCCLPIALVGSLLKPGYVSLWIEFKSKRGVISDVQQAWIAALRANAHRVEICRSWIEAANVVIDYLDLPMEMLKDA